MDIEEIKSKREILKNRLTQLVEEFEKETKACVKKIVIQHEGTGFVMTEDCMNPIAVHMRVEI